MGEGLPTACSKGLLEGIRARGSVRTFEAEGAVAASLRHYALAAEACR